MRLEVLKFLSCPACAGSLTCNPNSQDGDHIISGELVCSSCETRFDIVSGIPRLITNAAPMKNSDKGFSNQWNIKNSGRFYDAKIQREESNKRYQKVLDTFQLDGYQDEFQGVFLDAGCGDASVSKMVAINNPNCMVIGFDISDGIRVAFENTRHLDNYHAVEGDISKLPFSTGAFNYIWCEGVLHHTPAPHANFMKLQKLCAPGGLIYVWLYPSYLFRYYMFARDLFKGSYLLPKNVVYVLSCLIAAPIFLYYYFIYAAKSILRPSISRNRIKHSYRYIVFCLHDSLCPKYQFRYSQEEGIEWYNDEIFRDVRLVGDVGVVGTRK